MGGILAFPANNDIIIALIGIIIINSINLTPAFRPEVPYISQNFQGIVNIIITVKAPKKTKLLNTQYKSLYNRWWDINMGDL